MSEEKQSLFYPLQDGFSEAILLTRWNNLSTKYAYKSGFIRPKKGSIPVNDGSSSSNSQRDSQREVPYGHQEVPSPQRRSASSRHVTMWPFFRRQTDQTSTSSSLDKSKRLMSETKELGEKNDISDEWQKRFDKVVVEYKKVLRKINHNEKYIEEYVSSLEKEFVETSRKEQKQYIEELEKESGIVKELHEKVGDLFQNDKAENGDEVKEAKGAEEFQQLRIKFLEVLEAEIKNSSDKKETFGSWERTIDRLCSDRELIKEGDYDAVGRDMFMIHNPTLITDGEPDKVNEHCKSNDQIYKLLISICDSLYPEFAERKRLGELRARIESIEERYRQRQSNTDGISVLYMCTRETAEYSDLLLKEIKRCIERGEQVEQLWQEAKKLRQGLQAYREYAGELEDSRPRHENLRTAYKNVFAIEAIYKQYDKQKQRERLSRILRLGRRGQPEQRREL